MAFRNIQFTGIGRPVIKIAEIKNGVSGQTKFTDAEYECCYFVTAGDMLFSWSGQPETSIDVSWWHGPDGWLNQHIFKVQPNEELCDWHFFYYLLKYLKPSFIAIASNKQTTGLGHVTTRDLKNIQVGIPPLPEQHAIAAILGALDDKIELNRQMNQTLEAMAQALFKSWFVDFEPFRDQGMEDSPLGRIPRGWDIGKLSNLCSTQYGYTASAIEEPVGPHLLRSRTSTNRTGLNGHSCRIAKSTNKINPSMR
jgi:type I restriction enzyme S subunit